jgi:hypothetical protein
MHSLNQSSHKLLLIGCLVLSLVLAAADKPHLRSMSEVLGCYDINLGSWEPQIALGKDDAFITPPKRVELTNSPSAFQQSGAKKWWVVRTVQLSTTYAHPYSQWSLASDGAIVISWGNGFSGLSARLSWDGRRYVGTAETFWDFSRETQKAVMSLTPVRCNG